jgi:hypothetical protein
MDSSPAIRAQIDPVSIEVAGRSLPSGQRLSFLAGRGRVGG